MHCNSGQLGNETSNLMFSYGSERAVRRKKKNEWLILVPLPLFPLSLSRKYNHFISFHPIHECGSGQHGQPLPLPQPYLASDHKFLGWISLLWFKRQLFSLFRSSDARWWPPGREAPCAHDTHVVTLRISEDLRSQISANGVHLTLCPSALRCPTSIWC